MIISNGTTKLMTRLFLQSQYKLPFLFIVGDAVDQLQTIPSESIDMVMTSPPYWGQRDYFHNNTIGSEATIQEYITSLLKVFCEIKRVLKPTGSFWLNSGDSYKDKNLCNVPHRMAIALQDTQGWILRNTIVWNKLKGNPDNSKDKLRNTHEYIFHFVKQKKYFYDIDSVRKTPHTSTIKNGQVTTATGVTGVNYRRQIQRSTALSISEKLNALQALDTALQKVAQGELPDFRMVIRGQQRTTHSDSATVSGRASELAKKGFYILNYDKKGSKPSDVWEVVPEDKWRKDTHYAPFPEELCVMPIKLTSPLNGVVLDPFAGTGTSIITALKLGRRGIGIDISEDYLQTAVKRLDYPLSEVV